VSNVLDSHLLQVTVKSIIDPAQHLFKGITFEIESENGTVGGKMTLHKLSTLWLTQSSTLKIFTDLTIKNVLSESSDRLVSLEHFERTHFFQMFIQEMLIYSVLVWFQWAWTRYVGSLLDNDICWFYTSNSLLFHAWRVKTFI
jgi:hypothetical protein